MKRQRVNEGTQCLDICLMNMKPNSVGVSISPKVFHCKTSNHNHKRPKLEGKRQVKAEEFSQGRNRVATKGVFSSINEVVAKVSVLKRSWGTNVCCLDLNLTPLENDLKLFLFGKMATKLNL